MPGRLHERFGFRYRIIGIGDKVTLKRIIHVPEPGVHNPETGNTVLTRQAGHDEAMTGSYAAFACPSTRIQFSPTILRTFSGVVIFFSAVIRSG